MITATNTDNGNAFTEAMGLGMSVATLEGASLAETEPRSCSAMWTVWGLAATASGAACAYHGYKRNQSIGWAIAWFLLGEIFFPLTPAIALAQGFGKPKTATK